MEQTNGGNSENVWDVKVWSERKIRLFFRHRFWVIQFAVMGRLWWGLECPGVGESGMCSALCPFRSDIVKQNIVIFLAGRGGEP